MKDNDSDDWGVVGKAIKLYFHPLTVMHRKGIVFAWFFSMAFVAGSFYILGQKVDAIEVEPTIIRFNSNDSELEEKILFYEDLLMGLLVCTDVK